MNRGSVSAREARAHPDYGFNEAPIHESGKSERRGRRRRPGFRFNEAPIHESGKSRNP